MCLLSRRQRWRSKAARPYENHAAWSSPNTSQVSLGTSPIHKIAHIKNIQHVVLRPARRHGWHTYMIWYDMAWYSHIQKNNETNTPQKQQNIFLLENLQFLISTGAARDGIFPTSEKSVRAPKNPCVQSRGMQHNTQHTTHNTHNTQHATHNTQHTTHNTQHTTLKRRIDNT